MRPGGPAVQLVHAARQRMGEAGGWGHTATKAPSCLLLVTRVRPARVGAAPRWLAMLLSPTPHASSAHNTAPGAPTCDARLRPCLLLLYFADFFSWLNTCGWMVTGGMMSRGRPVEGLLARVLHVGHFWPVPTKGAFKGNARSACSVPPVGGSAASVPKLSAKHVHPPPLPTCCNRLTLPPPAPCKLPYLAYCAPLLCLGDHGLVAIKVAHGSLGSL